MITIPEIQDALAELQGSIDHIYSLLPYTQKPEHKEQDIEQPQWSKEQWQSVLQLRAMFLNLEKKVIKLDKRFNEFLESPKKRRKYKEYD